MRVMCHPKDLAENQVGRKWFRNHSPGESGGVNAASLFIDVDDDVDTRGGSEGGRSMSGLPVEKTGI